MEPEEYPEFHSDYAIVHAELIKDKCGCGVTCRCDSKCDCSSCDCQVCAKSNCSCGGNCRCEG